MTWLSEQSSERGNPVSALWMIVILLNCDRVCLREDKSIVLFANQGEKLQHKHRGALSLVWSVQLSETEHESLFTVLIFYLSKAF